MVAQKSAQVAWTDGVLLNYIGRRIDIDPCPMIVMFAKEGGAKEFNDEKLTPMIEATPHLMEKIPIASRRDKNNRWNFKGFPGGFLKLVGSNSPSSVKSTPAPVVCVEEPDDCNTNIKEQGDTITLLIERTKGFSAVEQAYKTSDKRKFFVPCPDCGQESVLSWDNVKWNEDPNINHEVYGHAVLDSAYYVCPHCGTVWDDAKKNRAVRQGVWRATAPFNDTAGFYINEIYSPFPGSRFRNLVDKYLTAKHALDQGDDSKMRSFFNSQLGLPYAFKSGLPEPDVLAERVEDYDELTVPEVGCVLTAGVDVQHDRLAVIIRAWGPGGETGTVSKSGATFDKVPLKMKTIAAKSFVSRNMLMQPSIGVESFVRRELITAIALGLDLAALCGSGEDGMPLGVANQAGECQVSFRRFCS